MTELRCHCGDGPFANGAELAEHQKEHEAKAKESVTLEEPKQPEPKPRASRKRGRRAK